MSRFFVFVAVAFLSASQSIFAAGKSSSSISYNRDVRPILSDNCFYCHGPDPNKRKAKMRLDIREEALKKEAFVPGKPEASELVRRIFATDPEDMMPPPKSNKKLSAAQKETLRKWIAAGAKYELHWAYQKPAKPSIPPGANPLDFLVQQRLKAVDLSPNPEADRRTLARRLYFDLVGLPPKPEEVDAFARDKSRDAVSRLVDKLLASPHYGERMAIGWLDVVRFADTIGYHSDTPRNIWPYRDYVIKAFNDDKPFDQFTREQIAGDLLPHSSQEEKVGSAFNRLLLSTEEGGAQPKDYEARMLTDRVRAIGTVWLGQTIGCAQCHDHKFDPITSRDFYSMGAFFADIQEPIIGKREDGMLVPNDAQAAQLTKLANDVKNLEADYNGPHPELNDSYLKWEQEQSRYASLERLWVELAPAAAKSAGKAKLKVNADKSILVSGPNPDKDTYTLTFTNLPSTIEGLRLEALPDPSLPGQGPGRAGNGNFVLSRIQCVLKHTNGTSDTISFTNAVASFEQARSDTGITNQFWDAASVVNPASHEDSVGWAILPQAGTRLQLIAVCASTTQVNPEDKLKIELRHKSVHAQHALGHFRISVTTNLEAVNRPKLFGPAPEIADLFAVEPEKRSQAQKDKLWAEFKKTAPPLTEVRQKLEATRKAKTDYETPLPHCLVSVSSDKPRAVRILPRGNFLDETGDIVHPALPGYLKASWEPLLARRSMAASRDSSAAPAKVTRLDLAEWLVSPENPLTARVTMNRLWKQFFGGGIAKSLDDFGAQGEPPKNQELLDWLACEFTDSGWDLKHIVRLMLNSRTYRQSSVLSKKAAIHDPYNREFSAQGRWRFEAELVRDDALAVSDLLVPKIGGPSVKPYQPDGYWENLNFPPRTYQQSTGEDQYRRGLYVWWQRSYLHPSLLAFDAPTREECVAERNRSNIPQQALVLLNDPTYVEASRAFAARILTEAGTSTDARIRWAWRKALEREPRTDERSVATDLLQKHLAEYRSDTKAADALLHVGLAPISDKLDHAELAAWTSVARLVLNLHETITRN
ncbi:MAG TPA: PSD1 and planctomycete cytochrome C domain-containing protein [Candidatus Dormibacteraeota bacterium]|nr:PSD1 and planctomycete cytochrome C domain-containing protein [Candidatus Dormibacteraeota bacterium]